MICRISSDQDLIEAAKKLRDATRSSTKRRLFREICRYLEVPIKGPLAKRVSTIVHFMPLGMAETECLVQGLYLKTMEELYHCIRNNDPNLEQAKQYLPFVRRIAFFQFCTEARAIFSMFNVPPKPTTPKKGKKRQSTDVDVPTDNNSERPKEELGFSDTDPSNPSALISRPVPVFYDPDSPSIKLQDSSPSPEEYASYKHLMSKLLEIAQDLEDEAYRKQAFLILDNVRQVDMKVLLGISKSEVNKRCKEILEFFRSRLGLVPVSERKLRPDFEIGSSENE